jgi:hypothetical protein
MLPPVLARPMPGLLGLLHPGGQVARVALPGAGCAVLQPEEVGRADLVVYAPTYADLRCPGALAQSVRSLTQALSPGGCAYILAPAPLRLAVRRQLASAGLAVRLQLLHLPSLASSQYLVPAAPAPLHYAVNQLIPARRGRRAAVLAGLRLPGGLAALTLALPGLGMVAQWPDSPPPLSWLGDYAETILRQSGDGAMATAYCFTPGASLPATVVKIALTAAAAERVLVEGAMLRRLGTAAACAGAAVPAAGLRAAPTGPALSLSAISGRPAALVLAASPHRLEECAEALYAWVARWHLATRQDAPLDDAAVARELLGPLATLAPVLPTAQRYGERLAGRCRRLIGAPVPRVAAHGDLTMWNLLLDRQGDPGVVDWEAGQPAGLPMTDLFYALADAAAAARGYAGRLAAVQGCYSAGGADAWLAGRIVARLQRALGISDELVRLCFHACWLGHAANELSRSGAGPFVAIARWLSEGGELALEGADGG